MFVLANKPSLYKMWACSPQFPMYWFSVPGILKGWFDRVLTSGFAFSQDKRYSLGIFKVRAQSRFVLISKDPVASTCFLFSGQESHVVLYHWVSGIHV